MCVGVCVSNIAKYTCVFCLFQYVMCVIPLSLDLGFHGQLIFYFLHFPLSLIYFLLFSPSQCQSLLYESMRFTCYAMVTFMCSFVFLFSNEYTFSPYGISDRHQVSATELAFKTCMVLTVFTYMCRHCELL